MTYLIAAWRYFDPTQPARPPRKRAADLLSALAWGFAITAAWGLIAIARGA